MQSFFRNILPTLTLTGRARACLARGWVFLLLIAKAIASQTGAQAAVSTGRVTDCLSASYQYKTSRHDY